MQPLTLACAGSRGASAPAGRPAPRPTAQGCPSGPCLPRVPQRPPPLTLAAEDTIVLEGRLHELVIGLLEETLCRAYRGGDKGQ